MADSVALLGPVAAQYSNRSRFAAWRRAFARASDGDAAITAAHLISLAQAAGSEVSLSSPLGRYMMGQSLRQAAILKSTIGESPFLNWLRESV